MASFHQLSQNVLIQPIIFPVSGLGVTIQPSGAYIDVTTYDNFAFLVVTGVSDRTTATIQIVQATSAAGAGSKNLTGAVNTTLPTSNSKAAIVESRTEALDINNGFRYVAVQPTFSGGTGDVGTIIFFAWRARAEAVTQPAAITSIITV